MMVSSGRAGGDPYLQQKKKKCFCSKNFPSHSSNHIKTRVALRAAAGHNVSIDFQLMLTLRTGETQMDASALPLCPGVQGERD